MDSTWALADSLLADLRVLGVGLVADGLSLGDFSGLAWSSIDGLAEGWELNTTGGGSEIAYACLFSEGVFLGLAELLFDGGADSKSGVDAAEEDKGRFHFGVI